MLVLSRRPNEDILFPNLGIRIRLLGLKGNVARIGIEAPPDVQILRAEVEWLDNESSNNAPPQTLSHGLRNRLNKVTLGLHRFHQQWQAGLVAEANATFQHVLDVLEALDREAVPAAAVPAKEAPKTSRRCRTLLVEDDANERELLAGILGMSGYPCDTVADGQDALDYLSSHEPPDLVLLDMGLPRVSGPQTFARIRQEPRCRGVKVFAISGSNPVDLGIAIGDGGVDAWFQKPLNPGRLREAMVRNAPGVPETN